MKTKLFIFIIGLIITNQCLGQNYVQGNQSGTWYAGQSYYIMYGDVTVLSGETLTIEEGASVHFWGQRGLIIYGTLVVEGTENSHVQFLGRPYNFGNYGGHIRFKNSSNNVIEYGEFNYLTCDPGEVPGGKNPFGAIHIENSEVTFDNCRFYSNGFHLHETYTNFGLAGAVGIHGTSSNVTFSNTEFDSNQALGPGGAIFNSGNNDISILSCTFKYNAADFLNSKSAVIVMDTTHLYKSENPELYSRSLLAVYSDCYDGGAIYSDKGNITINNCRFNNNNAANGGAVFHNSYGGIGILDIDNTTFKNNRAYDDGGAICLDNYGIIDIKNSLFHHNESEDVNGNISGGAIRAKTSHQLTLSFNTFCYNNIEEDNPHSSTLHLGDGLGIINCDDPYTFKNNIVYHNGLANSDNIYGMYNAIDIDYSDVGNCIQGVSRLVTSLNEDPKFENSTDNFRLKPISPCIDFADPNTTGIIYDLVWNHRPLIDGYDMGAYEYGLVYIIPDQEIICSGDVIEFNIGGIDLAMIESYSWDFDDGNTTNTPPTVYHAFYNTSLTEIVYNVELTVILLDGKVWTDTQEITVYPNPKISATPTSIREGQSVHFSSTINIPLVSWQLYYLDPDGLITEIASDGPFAGGEVFNLEHTFLDAGDGEIEVYLDFDYGPIPCQGNTVINVCSGDCIYPFAPIPGEKYILSAWVSEDIFDIPQTTFTIPAIQVSFLLNNGNTIDLDLFKAKGQIIDGWQKIEETLTIDANAIDITISLLNTNWEYDSFFDDIRIFPINGNMKSFVYDPVNLRFVAELDENNYATYYEYDQEGKLTRVKKETVKGIVTLQESRSHMSKLSFDNQ